MWDMHDLLLAAGACGAQAEVHREDHVGRVGALRHHVDPRTEPAQGGDQLVPLVERARRVGLDGGIHEGVDRVVDPEMRRLDRDVVVSPQQLAQRDLPDLPVQIVRQSDIPSVAHGCRPRKNAQQ